MNKNVLGVLVSGVAALVLAVPLASAKLPKEEYKQVKNTIDVDYKSARERCGSLAGNAKDICMAEAKGNQKVARAELDARDKNTNKAWQEAHEARAAANYDIAKERCDEKGGNAKDVCMQEAKAARTAAIADAKVARKAQDARVETNQEVAKARSKENERVAEARKDAAEDKREADYAVAKERCGNLAGDAKDRCLEQAKARHAGR